MTLKLGILGSGEGANTQAVIDAIESGGLDAEIVAVISDREDADILERARTHNIDPIFLEYGGKGSSLFDKAAAKELEKRGAEFILLDDFMRALSRWFCKHYENRIMNVRPSLLPLFAGKKDLEMHQEVLKNGMKVTGCTIHFVTPKADAGPIIMQKPVPVSEDDTPETLGERVRAAEREVIVETLSLLSERRVSVEGGRVSTANKSERETGPPATEVQGG